MSRRTWEDVGIGVGAIGLIAGGVYILDKQGLIHLPSFVHPSTTTTSHSSSGLPALNVAPQTLPSSVPVRCGTVYVSFGPSPHDSNMIMVGKYTNAKLIDQYYQPATHSSSFNTAGAYAGGFQCGNTSTSSGGSGSSSAQSAAKGWADIGNGCYVAQSGATLSGLAAALGTSYYTLANINHISNPNVIQIGQHVGYPHACAGSSGSSGGSGSSSSIAANSLWQISGQAAVYIYQNGQMHWICSPSLASAHGISLTNIHVVSQLPAGVGDNYAGCHATGPTPQANNNVNNIPNWTFYPPKCWKAQSGANLSTLSAYLGISVSQLASWNNIQNPNTISVGTTICLK